jgi:prophage tail gpP-like protein
MIPTPTHHTNPSAKPNLPILPPVWCVATLGAVSPAAPKPLFRAASCCAVRKTNQLNVGPLFARPDSEEIDMAALCEPLTELERTAFLDMLDVCRDAGAHARRAKSNGDFDADTAGACENRAVRTANTVREMLGIRYREEVVIG